MADQGEIVVKKLKAVSISDALDYIGQMSAELCEMAKATQVSQLIFHLNQARLICEESREEELSIVRVYDKLLEMQGYEKTPQ